MATKLTRRQRIKHSVRKRVFGSSESPRLTVFRSNKQIYVQVIDDVNGKTLVSASSRQLKLSDKQNKIEVAKQVGKEIADKAKGAGVTSVVFDRNGYLYHGRVKALGDAAREGGLKF
jgi:large subunit ribosomal protein L18